MFISNNSPIGIYGFGKAGRSLSVALRQTGSPVIVFCRNPNRIQIDHAKKYDVKLHHISKDFFKCLQNEKAQILFIAVTDGVISSLSHEWRDLQSLPPVVAHLSGAHSANHLEAIKHLSFVAQFHPLISLDGISPMPKCLVAINSENAKAVDCLTVLAKSLSCHPVEIGLGTQSLYHAAAAITGNLSAGLVLISLKLMEKCGIEKRQAQSALAKLLRSTANALENDNLSAALTGPIARGDEVTIANHVAALSEPSLPREFTTIYQLLSKQLISEGSFSKEKRENLLSALADELNDS